MTNQIKLNEKEKKIKSEIFTKLLIPKSLPIMPGVAIEIMGYTDDEDMPIEKIAEIILKDPALVAQILRVANSAYYAVRRHIGSLKEAIILLGLREIKNLIFTLSVVRLFSNEGNFSFNKAAFLRHCLLTAKTADTIASDCRLTFDTSPFVAGLLHDIGKIFLDQNFHQHYTKVIEIANQNQKNLYEIEQDKFGIDHAQIGAEIASIWHFPTDLVHAIKYHHSVEESNKYMILSSIVHLSNILTNSRCTELPYPDKAVSIEDSFAWKKVTLEFDTTKIDIERIIFEIDDQQLMINNILSDLR